MEYGCEKEIWDEMEGGGRRGGGSIVFPALRLAQLERQRTKAHCEIRFSVRMALSFFGAHTVL